MRHSRAMRQTLRSWSLGACVLSLVLGAPALAEEVEVEVASGYDYPSVQLIGWSRDEQRYAFRTYFLKQEDNGLEPGSDAWDAEQEKVKALNAPLQDAEGFCKGYVNHQGKRFKGALQLVVLERDKILRTLPIQDHPLCTDPKLAASRLAEAKQELAGLGIDASQVGKELKLVSGQKLQVKPEKQPPYAVEYIDRVLDISDELQKGEEEVDPTLIRLRGTLELLMHRGGKKQKVYSRKVDRENTRVMGGMVEESLSNLYVSPSGERLVVLDAERSGNGRSGFNAVLKVVAVVGWPKTAVAKDK